MSVTDSLKDLRLAADRKMYVEANIHAFCELIDEGHMNLLHHDFCQHKDYMELDGTTVWHNGDLDRIDHPVLMVKT